MVVQGQERGASEKHAYSTSHAVAPGRARGGEGRP